MREIVRLSSDQRYTGVLRDCRGDVGMLQVWEGARPLWRPKDLQCLARDAKWISPKHFVAVAQRPQGPAIVVVDVVSRLYGLQPTTPERAAFFSEDVDLPNISWAPWY